MLIVKRGRDDLLSYFRAMPPDVREKYAAQLMVLDNPKFHGSKTIHYADGNAKKIVDTVTKDI